MSWVSVSDRLPSEDDGPECVVWLTVPEGSAGGLGGCGYWDVAHYRDGRWTLAEIDGAGGGECHPTHWMVPSAPPGWDEEP